MILQTAESFWSEMVRLNSNPKLRKDSAYAFDVAWVIALTLNATMADGLTYERLNKRAYEEVHLIKKWIRNTNFEGITVRKMRKMEIFKDRFPRMPFTRGNYKHLIHDKREKKKRFAVDV